MKFSTLSLLLGSTSAVTITLDTGPLEESAQQMGSFLGDQVMAIEPDEEEELLKAAERA